MKNFPFGAMGLLTLVFVIFKLCKVIAWSWWWVFSPLIVFTAIYIIFVTIVFVLMVKCKG